MGTGYTRNDTSNNIADGNVINASDLDGEFDAVQAAFNGTTGHSHDGTSGEGPQIDTAGLADNAVTTAKITNANVTTAKIADANVTLAKMATNSVDSDQYVDGSIDTAHIANDAVTLGTKTSGNYVAAGATSGTGLSGSVSSEGGTFTVTSNATNANTAGAIVARDGSGNFSAGTITASLTGTASNANQLDSLDSTQFLRSDTADTKTAGDLTFSDNVKAKFGGGGDLEIYHDNPNGRSTIADVGVGDLEIHATDFSVKNATRTSTYMSAVNGGAVTLRYNGSTKLATKSDGVDITGELQSDSLDVDGNGNISGTLTMGGNVDLQDNDKLMIGSSDDLQIYHNGSNSFIEENGTGSLYIDATNFNLRSSAHETYLTAVENGAVKIYYDNSKKFETTSGGVSVSGNIAVSGTVDGRDVASDGSKLDGIASGAQTGTVTSVATGGGLTGGTITGSGTISHADTSSQASVNNSGSNFIQDITLDTYGHVTAITSAAAGGATTGTYTPTTTFSSNNNGYPSMNIFGQYVKIDEMVFLQVEFDYFRWNAGGTQTVSLPFTSKAATALNGALVVGYMDTGTNNGESYNWVIRENATTMSGPAIINGSSQQVRATFNVMYRANS